MWSFILLVKICGATAYNWFIASLIDSGRSVKVDWKITDEGWFPKSDKYRQGGVKNKKTDIFYGQSLMEVEITNFRLTKHNSWDYNCSIIVTREEAQAYNYSYSQGLKINKTR